MPCLKAGRQRTKITSTASSRSSKILKVGILADLFNNSPTLPLESVAQMQVSYCHRMNDHDHDLLKGQKIKKFSGKPCIDGDATIWTTRPASVPLAQLAALADDKVCRQNSLQSHVHCTLLFYIVIVHWTLYIVIAHCLYNVFFAITMFSSVVPFDSGIYFRGPALKKQTL